MTDLMQGPGTGPETPPQQPSEDRARQMVAAYEEEAPAPVIEKSEPTTADLEAQLAQPAVEDEARDPQPTAEVAEPTPVNPANVLDLSAQGKVDASAQLNQVYAKEAAVANEAISQTAPGSPEEKAAYDAMKANIAPQVAAIQNEKLADTPDAAEKPAANKKSIFKPSTWFK